jgi:transmembrane sensor
VQQNLHSELLQRFFRHECSDAEHAAVLDWLQQCSEEERMVLIDQHAADVMAGKIPINTRHEVPFVVLEQEIARRDSARLRAQKGRRYWWAAAASVALLLSAFWWWQPTEKPLAVLPAVPGPAAPAALPTAPTTLPPGQTIANTGRQQKMVRLPDSSRVYLAQGAQLEYESGFGVSHRALRLRGEAYFAVRRREYQPFVVQTGAMRTQVLGTTFTIKAEPGSTIHEVLVFTGKVAVSAPGAGKVILTANQKTTFYVKAAQFNTDSFAGQSGGSSIAFNNTPLPEVLKALEEEYGAVFTLDNADLRHCLVTATLQAENLEQAMTRIVQSIGASFTRNGQAVRISGMGCTPPE